MSDNILVYPALELQNLINSSIDNNKVDIINLFIFAIDKNLPRYPLKKLISSKDLSYACNEQSIKAFISWATKVSFITKKDLAELCEEEYSTTYKDTSDIENHDILNEERENLFNEIREIGSQVADLRDYAQTHKYWFFRPGWEIDTETWQRIFEDHDPAKTIAYYLSNIFKPESNELISHKLILAEDDKEIISYIINQASQYLAKKAYSKESKEPSIYTKSLIAGLNLEEIFDSEPFAKDLDFINAINTIPSWISILLIDYWATREDFQELITYSPELITKQAKFMASCLLKYMKYDSFKDNSIIKYSYISDKTIVHLMDRIECVSIELDTYSDFSKILNALSEALYSSRHKVFGGRFPFHFIGSKDLIGRLSGDPNYWLADITFYDAEEYDELADDFRVFSTHNTDNLTVNADKRTNNRAIERLAAFKNALTHIQNEKLHEFATAWWAFFIATQAIAFEGLGLAPSEIKEIANIAKDMLPNESLRRAILFAMQIINDSNKNNYDSRVATAILRPIISSEEDKNFGNVIFLNQKSNTVDYLKKLIGAKYWEWISETSRHELMEAEEMVNLSLRSHGLDRNDWGSIIRNYYGPVEAEVRDKTSPIISDIVKLSLSEIKEPTFGGIVNCVKRANHHIRKNPQNEYPDNLKNSVKILHKYFCDNYEFLVDFRNLAAHANRLQPIKFEDFYKIRVALYEGKVFQILHDAAKVHATYN